MMKIARSRSAFGSESGSISQRHGSADPDPHQNVMDPQHCYQAVLLVLPDNVVGMVGLGVSGRLPLNRPARDVPVVEPVAILNNKFSFKNSSLKKYKLSLYQSRFPRPNPLPRAQVR
jgi:hypothetical protein